MKQQISISERFSSILREIEQFEKNLYRPFIEDTTADHIQDLKPINNKKTRRSCIKRRNNII